MYIEQALTDLITLESFLFIDGSTTTSLYPKKGAVSDADMDTISKDIRVNNALPSFLFLGFDFTRSCSGDFSQLFVSSGS